jgi:hypothetical protein
MTELPETTTPQREDADSQIDERTISPAHSPTWTVSTPRPRSCLAGVGKPPADAIIKRYTIAGRTRRGMKSKSYLLHPGRHRRLTRRRG